MLTYLAPHHLRMSERGAPTLRRRSGSVGSVLSPGTVNGPSEPGGTVSTASAWMLIALATGHSFYERDARNQNQERGWFRRTEPRILPLTREEDIAVGAAPPRRLPAGCGRLMAGSGSDLPRV